jgi:hypothetical protein
VAVESGQQVRQISAPPRPAAPAGSGTPHIALTSGALIGYIEGAALTRTPDIHRIRITPAPLQPAQQEGNAPNIPVDLQPVVLPQHQAAAAAQAAPAEMPSAPLTQLAQALDVLDGIAPQYRTLTARVRAENRALGVR